MTKELSDKNDDKSVLALFDYFEKLNKRIDKLEEKLDQILKQSEENDYEALTKAQLTSMDFWNSKEDKIWDDWDYDLDKDENYINSQGK